MRKSKSIQNVKGNRRIVSHSGYRDWAAVLLFIFLLPFLVAFFWGRMSGEEGKREVWKRTEWEDAELLICCETRAGWVVFSMEDYLICRLPATIPMDYEMEALKAQAVVLRTELLRTYKERAAKRREEGRIEVRSTELSIHESSMGQAGGEAQNQPEGAVQPEAGMGGNEAESMVQPGAGMGGNEAESMVQPEAGMGGNEAESMIQPGSGRRNVQAADTERTDEIQIMELEKRIEEKYGIPCLYVETYLGEMDESVYERSREAVAGTEGIYLCYEEEPARAPFFAVSAGRTRNGSEVQEMAEYPYLQSVSCDRDFTSPDYTDVVTVSREEFYQWLSSICMGKEVQRQGEAELMERIVIEKDSSGYITQIKVGEAAVSGERFRDFFGLASACVEIEERGDQIRMKSSGAGHGFGMSQYGAHEAAKNGSDFMDILEYFYADLRMKK